MYNLTDTTEKDYIPKFEIPLVMKNEQVGVIEAIGFKREGEAEKLVFSGYLLKPLAHPEKLVELLKLEGMYLGKR